MTRDEHVARLRPLMTRALHAVWPDVPLVDCARAANEVMDRIADGEMDLAIGARDFFAAVIGHADVRRRSIH